MPKQTWEQRISNWGEKHGHAGESYAQKKAAYYEHRVTSRATREGLDPTSYEGRRAGRGHGSTPEHGYREQAVGDTIMVTLSGKNPLGKVGRALDRIESKEYGSRAALIITKQDGTRVRLFAGGPKTTSGRRGYSISGMQKAVASGDFAGGMADSTGSPDLESLIDDAAEIQIEVF